jgi:choloylglycine hydrolase
MKQIKVYLAEILFLVLLGYPEIFPCTAFMVKSKDGGVITGRSLDYSQASIYNTTKYGIGSVIPSVLDSGKVKWVVKIDFITVNNVLQGNYLVAFEGMNKNGISISGNLADAEYPNNIPNVPTLSSDDIVRYILALSSTMDDAIKLFSNMNIISKWKYHYILFDQQGHSLVVEFHNGKPVFYKDKTQILTNNPNMDYQLANLNIYSNLRNYNANAITPDSGNQFHGQGMFGLPGDWMAPSRFIRGYFMIKFGQDYIDSTKDAINLAAKILDSVSLIKGVDLGKTEKSNPIYTQIQIIKDLKNNTIYLKRYNDFKWEAITL